MHFAFFYIQVIVFSTFSSHRALAQKMLKEEID